MNKQSPNFLDFFELYLNDDFWQLLGQETTDSPGSSFLIIWSQLVRVNGNQQILLKCLRKSYKWYRKLALRLIAQMALNAHKVHKKTTGFNLSLLDFVKACIQLLISSLPALPPNEAGIPDDTHYRLTGQQFPSVKVAREGASNQRPAKACRVCYARGEKQQLKNNLELFSCANIVLVNLDYIPKYVSKSAIPCQITVICSRMIFTFIFRYISYILGI